MLFGMTVGKVITRSIKRELPQSPNPRLDRLLIMPSRKGRIRAMVVVTELFERDSFSVKIDTFEKRVTGVVGCEVVNIEDTFLLQVSLIRV